MNGLRLLAGPDLRGGAETMQEHRRRLGPWPAGDPGLVDVVGRSGLLGRGGAAFPVAVKWRSVSDRARGGAVVLVNGAEGEPLSWKDRLLLEARPHLVLDGAFIAAGTVGADQVVLYVGERHRRALETLSGALEAQAGRQRLRAA